VKARILIVEDDARVAGFLRSGLVDQDFSVDVARSCADALKAFALSPPDLVLLDLGLPDGDGLKLLPELRGQRTRLPIIAVTARDGIDQRVAGLEAGADDYLVKPYAFAELLRAHPRAAAPQRDGAADRTAGGGPGDRPDQPPRDKGRRGAGSDAARVRSARLPRAARG
jgi:DNA-binding response OmpR family regulator